MRAVIQRVSEAAVSVGGNEISRIGHGLLILLGVETGDDESRADWLAGKIAGLRIFEDENDKLNLSVQDIGGEALVVSQFTLLGECRKGRRPDFTKAAPGEEAERLYEYFCVCLEKVGVPVRKGKFAALMDVSLVNHGPVTLVVDRD
jgi:D-tyrosyl-tRNA(Tyr) deacylase